MAKPSPSRWRRLGRDLFLYPDSCNVYLLRCGDAAVCIDYGTGSWRRHLDQIGVRQVSDVVLTHAHRDQCCGLYRQPDMGAGGAPTVHVPTGDAHLLDEAGLTRFWETYQSNGCPSNYAAPRLPVPGARADVGPDAELLVGAARLCALPTPGHTRGALTYVVSWHGRQLAFCGDAAHARGRLWQPYHLEWDHWTPEGALAAWYGLERLQANRIDALLPSHGPVVRRDVRGCLQRLQGRLMDLVRAKGSVCPDEPARWLEAEPMACGALRLSPHLYAYGGNGYLLLSDCGDGFVVDPTVPDMPALEGLCRELSLGGISAATASHYHLDHADAFDHLRRVHGTSAWLHPQVAEPLVDRDRFDVPWLPADSLRVDRLLPRRGAFRWREYRMGSRDLAGQTHWHAAFLTEVDGRRVLFSGDSFQPPTRWNGTGGFCAFNRSRFDEGFADSARAVMDLAPDIICNGHRCMYRYARSQYRGIVAWAGRAGRAVGALCPSAAWLADYDVHATRFEPFCLRARRGSRIDLSVVHHNHGTGASGVEVALALPPGWKGAPAHRARRIAAGRQRTCRFCVTVPRAARPGRWAVGADVELDGQVRAEACVALVDVT